MRRPSNSFLLRTLVLLVPAVLFRLLPEASGWLRLMPLAIPAGLLVLCIDRERSLLDDGIPQAVVGGAGAGIIIVSASSTLLESGFHRDIAVVGVLVAAVAARLVHRDRYRGGALLFLPAALFIDPGATLPLALSRTPDSSVILGGVAALMLAFPAAFALLAPGVPRLPAAVGAILGCALALGTMGTARSPEIFYLGETLFVLAGMAEFARRILTAGPRVRGFRFAAATAAAAVAALLLRGIFPGAEGPTPTSFSSADFSRRQTYGPDARIVVTRDRRHIQTILLSDMGPSPFRPGDLDIFSGANLGVAYCRRPRRVLLAGVMPDTTWRDLYASGLVSSVHRATPSPWPIGSPIRIDPIVGDRDTTSPYDLVSVDVSAEIVAALLDPLERRLAPGGVMTVRRLGEARDAPPPLRRLVESFPNRKRFWNTERSGIWLLSEAPLAFHRESARRVSLAVFKRVSSTGRNHAAPVGAWLRRGADSDPESRTETAALLAGAGDRIAAHVMFGRPKPPEKPVATRAIILFGRHGDIPGWLLLGPIGAWQGIDLLAGRLKTMAPAEGEQVPLALPSHLRWQAAVSSGHRPGEPWSQVPFRTLSRSGDRTSYCLGYTNLTVPRPTTLQLVSERLAIAWIDGRRIEITGALGVKLGKGSHRILLKAFSFRDEAPVVHVWLAPHPDPDVAVRLDLLPPSIRRLSTQFKMWQSRLTASRGEVLLGIESPPIAKRLLLDRGGIRRSIEFDDHDKTIPLSDSGRLFVRLQKPKPGEQISVSLEGSGFCWQASIDLTKPERRPIFLAPVVTSRKALKAVLAGREAKEPTPVTVAATDYLSDIDEPSLSDTGIDVGATTRILDPRIMAPGELTASTHDAIRLAKEDGLAPSAAILRVGSGIDHGAINELASAGASLIVLPRLHPPNRQLFALPRKTGNGAWVVLPKWVSGCNLGGDLSSLVSQVDGPVAIKAPLLLVEVQGRRSLARLRSMRQEFALTFPAQDVRFVTLSDYRRFAGKHPLKRNWPERHLLEGMTPPSEREIRTRTATIRRRAFRLLSKFLPATLLETGADPISLDSQRSVTADPDKTVILNPLPWARDAVIKLKNGRERLIHLPAMGYAGAAADTERAAPAKGEAIPGRIENRYYEIDFDPATGRMRAIKDRELGAALFAQDDSKVPFPTWLREPGGEEKRGGADRPVAENHRPPDPVRKRTDCRERIHLPFFDETGLAAGDLEITLYDRIKQIDFTVRLDTELRGAVAFPLALDRKRLDAIAPSGGLVTNPTESVTTGGGFLLESRKVAVAVASPDALLLRPKSLAFVLPAPRTGTIFRFSLQTAAALDSGFVPSAFIAKAIVPPVPIHVGQSPAASFCGLRLSPERVVLAEAEQADGSGLNLVITNLSGKRHKQKILFPTTGRYLTFPLASSVEIHVDPNEP